MVWAVNFLLKPVIFDKKKPLRPAAGAQLGKKLIRPPEEFFPSPKECESIVFRRFLQATANGNGPNAQLRAWLYRVAHNIVVDHYRRRNNQPGQLLQEQMPSEEADPGSAAEQRIQCEDVRRAMNHLTADQQEVIALKFLQGLTNDEIAHITRKSVGAVKALQHRALAALRRQLVPSLEEDTT